MSHITPVSKAQIRSTQRAQALRARALRAMADPVTIACVLVLLINDQLLRRLWPSWITGKLGDVAWLAFAPLVIALPLALIAPASRRRSNRTLIGVAVGLVGMVFATVKAVPAATAAFSSSFRSVFGWTPTIVCDPTDLLTLPALGIGIWVWMRATGTRESGRSGGKAPDAEEMATTRTPDGKSRRQPDHRRRAWVALALAALATLGNSGPPDEGVVCLELDGNRVLTNPQHSYAFTHTFASDDGGATWVMVEEDTTEANDVICEGRAGSWPLTTPEGEIYRLVPDKRIERSDDGGETWIAEYSLTGGDARLAYYQRTRSNYGGATGPHEALFDPATGNIIVAMGLEGVLVRTGPGAGSDSPGVWEWYAVGPYRYEPLTGIAQLATVLQGELGLALAAGFIIITMAGWRTHHWILRVLAVLVAAGTAITQLAFQPAITSNYGTVAAMGAVLVSLGAALILAIIALVLYVRRRMLPLWRLAGHWVLVVLLYAAPFVVWALGWLNAYTAAAWIAVVITVIAWVAAALAPRQTT